MKASVNVTGAASIVQTSDGALTVIVPLSISRRAGRRRYGQATNSDAASSALQLTSLQRALAKGVRWRSMLERGEMSSMKEIAETESTDNSYVGRIINLTLLAPEIVAGILDDTIPDVQIDRLGISPPLLWSDQRRLVGLTNHP
ncbi:MULTISPECIES: LacI family transcriptional regulator [unclassified Lysobacter]|uniref:LacI family transcriptional regulator n=1 Tax=unclassified Lysobacter TaxID=2635362 RepID=UPI001BEAB04A|nr:MULTISPECIES: LacI family transcriptional regulator [unclassified Lysobacter]MBT2748384.1 LacI family transcriptional regulator [Lysobacter sp. ISL-42]MBT2749849.1 LacI family transcriptional regulator [Lysobacter sp. ISL-50]MBT2781177.1 LacI family transcriptional regulator [Lysobacter sp. ISL-52]